MLILSKDVFDKLPTFWDVDCDYKVMYLTGVFWILDAKRKFAYKGWKFQDAVIDDKSSHTTAEKMNKAADYFISKHLNDNDYVIAAVRIVDPEEFASEAVDINTYAYSQATY